MTISTAMDKLINPPLLDHGNYITSAYEHGDVSLTGWCPKCGERVRVNLNNRLRLHNHLAHVPGGGMRRKPCPHNRGIT